jgi:hypothetical protein
MSAAGRWEGSGAGGSVPRAARQRREGYAPSYTPGPGSSTSVREGGFPIYVSGG